MLGLLESNATNAAYTAGYGNSAAHGGAGLVCAACACRGRATEAHVGQQLKLPTKTQKHEWKLAKEVGSEQGQQAAAHWKVDHSFLCERHSLVAASLSTVPTAARDTTYYEAGYPQDKPL